MERITTAIELKNAIQRLKVEQAIGGQLLKEQIYFVRESIQPVNLLRNTLHEVVSTPHLVDKVIGITLGLATGYVSRIAIVGVSGSIVKRLFGSVLQLGISSTVARHPDTIKSIGHYLFQHISRRKEKALPQ